MRTGDSSKSRESTEELGLETPDWASGASLLLWAGAAPSPLFGLPGFLASWARKERYTCNPLFSNTWPQEVRLTGFPLRALAWVKDLAATVS